MSKISKSSKSESPVVHEGELLRVIPTPRLQLSSIDDCRLEMAKVYRDAKSGKTDKQDASRLVYMLTSIAKMIEIGQLEQRLIALEEKQHGNN